MDEIEGRYHVSLAYDAGSFECIPDSHRIWIDYGALVIYDEDDQIIRVYAPGQWAQVFLDTQLEVDETYGDI